MDAEADEKTLRDELLALRYQDDALVSMLAKFGLPGREQLEVALENVRARRAHLAWVLDENDDRQLGREVALPMPSVAAGPSVPSFEW